MLFKKVGSVLLFFVLLCAGCIKEEYSYEGGLAQPIDSTTNPDTTTQIPIPSFACMLCHPNDAVQSMQWHFMYKGVTALCGLVTKAVLSPEKNALTFYGPSACTIDTGLIMTVFLDTLLDQDRVNIRAAQAVLQYYIKGSANDAFRSKAPDLNFIIDRFVQETKTATGRFSGYTFTPTGERVSIETGRFNITFSP